MRIIAAAGFLALGMMASQSARADLLPVPPFKGNDTGGIIAYSLATQADARQVAVDHCARYGKVVKFLAVQAFEGGYISFSCRWVPYGAAPTADPHAVLRRFRNVGSFHMTRKLALLGSALCLVVSAGSASADDLPVRKAGLWEMKMVRTGTPMPEMTMQHCTDETVDKEMNNNVSPMAKQICAKQDIKKAATGYVSDSECNVAGISTTSHAEITGDFNSAYTVKTSSHAQGGAAGAAGRDTTMQLEAKWLGACKPDQKPGDIVMPGGFKMNVRDMDKLKALLPK
ncbi:hypothetical protein ACVWZR_005030 [Bradyrhizobium sp. i1.3.1]